MDDETSGQEGLEERANVDELGDGVGDGVCDRIELGMHRTDQPASSLYFWFDYSFWSTSISNWEERKKKLQSSVSSFTKYFMHKKETNRGKSKYKS